MSLVMGTDSDNTFIFQQLRQRIETLERENNGLREDMSKLKVEKDELQNYCKYHQVYARYF